MKDLRARLHQRFATAIRSEARAAFEAGRRVAPPTFWAANLIALAILATPGLLILAGTAILFSSLPSPGGIFVGGILIATGLYVFPRRAKPFAELQRRADMPETFAAIDAICDRLEAPRITALVIDGSFNAFMASHRGERVLGVGAPLWVTLPPGQRLAVLAHEVAHQINGDPARTRLVHHALHTLDRWHDMVGFSGHDHWVTELVLLPFNALIELASGLLWRLIFLQSQRAEYLADGLAASVAGASDMTGALESLAINERAIEVEFLGAGGPFVPKGRAMMERIGAAPARLSADERARVLAATRAEELRVDQSHPPTAARIDFLADLPLGAAMFDAAALPGLGIGDEWARHLERVGNAIHKSYQRQ